MYHSMFGLGDTSTVMIRLVSADRTDGSLSDGFHCGNRKMLV